MIENEYTKFMNRLYEGQEISDKQFIEMRKAYFFGYINCFAYLTEKVLNENIAKKEISNEGLEKITILTKSIQHILSNNYNWDEINERRYN